MSQLAAFFLALLNLYYFTPIYGEKITLSITDGKIVGQVNSTIKNNVTFYSFRGIPFAKPPLGNLRFANPEKNDPWNGTLDATNDKNECPQFASAIFGVDNYSGDEDCLYLNVYTPIYSASANLPVLFWIHGGGFATGNNSYELYGPDYFVEKSLIVVTINYRLGVLGFLSTEDAACPGNWGIKDQILALKWVQENIKYFGGDPNKVTIFGESAGAVSVNLLLQTNLTKEGLFKGAILNSGTTLNVWGLNTGVKDAAFATGISLGILTTNTTTLIAKLREVNVKSLMTNGALVAQGIFLEHGLLRGLPFAPVMEPNVEGAVYVKPSETALQSGQFSQVPVLLGFNSQEAVALGDFLSGLTKESLSFLGLDAKLELLTPWSMTQNFIKRLAAGIDIKNHYFGVNLIATYLQGFINFHSADHYFRPIRKTATDMANFTSVYFYQFGYEGNVSAIFADRNFSGVGHAEDILYLFSPLFSQSTARDLKVSETMVLLWSNFVKFGNPTPYKDNKLNDTIWAPVDPKSTDFNYLVLNESISMSTNPKQSDWVFYTNLWQKYGDITPITTY